MPIELFISPQGRPFVEERSDGIADLPPAPAAQRIAEAFANEPWLGVLHLGMRELQTTLPPGLSFAREFACGYLTRLCQTPGLDDNTEIDATPFPPLAELTAIASCVPPIKGAEYLTADVLGKWWTALDEQARAEIRRTTGGASSYLRQTNAAWRVVGRVTFHLAENKRDADHPFAFLATYAGRISQQAKVIHQPLGRALQEYSGAGNRAALLSLLTPVQRAAEKSALVKELVESGDLYHPLAWTPRKAYRFLQDIPTFEESGLIVRVPDWWKANRPPRPVVSVKVGEGAKSTMGVDAIMDFSVRMTLEGEQLTEAELQTILQSTGGLVLLKGKWVEVDQEKLTEALKHWKQVERDAREEGVTFFQGMRLLSGATLDGDVTTIAPAVEHEWTGISAGAGLEQLLNQLRDPAMLADITPRDLRGKLRPYQQTGVNWLRFLTRLGLGACLADDMGLGKTIQIISLLLHLKREESTGASTSLLIVPASLIANWKAEIARFAPSLSVMIAHPSEKKDCDALASRLADDPPDLVITTYGMLSRMSQLSERRWRLVVLDEAQAIKNSGTRQTKAVKEIQAAGRIALTGTPIENRLSDLWSLFDFLNPGLLGGAKPFARFVNQLEQRTHNPYAPLRSLVRPYILRRMKTDKRVIADLPDKTEVTAFCNLSKQQAALYEQTVRELARQLDEVDGIKRRGIVLACLMRLKQICNHPAQLSGDGDYQPGLSGKFQRLRDICEELNERQEKALIFTQFREVTGPLAGFLQEIFGRPGLILHGQTAVGKRRELVEAFQRDDGPPFFVLSLKAGGTGLNLTAASHVIHFDRWWNPAVENQATDRAFRIGQKRNVLVHKFVCRGTVEEKIDAMIAEKSGLARDLLDGGGEVLLTEMDNAQLLRLVSLDVSKAMES